VELTPATPASPLFADWNRYTLFQPGPDSTKNRQVAPVAAAGTALAIALAVSPRGERFTARDL
jgi:hypothetical protein